MRNIKNKRFSVQRCFIPSLIISATIYLLFLAGGVTYAGETEEKTFINANCATVDDQISIDIPCVDFSSTRFSLTLDIYPNPADTEGLYFKLRDLPEISDSISSCAFIDNKLNLNINCAVFDGSQYKLSLESYANTLDNEWFYWKVVDSDNQNLENMAKSASGNQESIEPYDTDSTILRSSNVKPNQNQTNISPASEDLANKQAVRVGGTRANQPNLTPYTPSGWSDKIVVSTTTGTTTDSTTLSPTDTLYVDWAIINNGTLSASTTFYTKLYVDGVEKISWSTNLLLATNMAYVKDYSIGKLSDGTHTIKIKADSTGVISESNESDNEYTKTITVKPTPQPNLTPYTPSGWSDKIVVSTTTGTTTDSTTLSPTDTLYVDWAVINNGTLSASTTFYTKLYVDGVEKISWSTDLLLATNMAYVKDYSIGKLSDGTHTIKIKADSTGVISESNESDNEYTKTITVGSTKPIPPANMSATATSSSSIKITWSDSSNNETGFYLYRWNGSSWSNIKTLGAGITLYTDTGLTANTTYYYYVASYNNAGISPFNGNSNGYVSAKILSSIFDPVGGTWSGSIQVQVTSGAYKNFSVNNLTFDSFGKWTAKTTSNYSNIYGQVMPLGTYSYQGSYVMSGNIVSDKEGKFKMTFSDNNHLTGSFDSYSNFTLTR